MFRLKEIIYYFTVYRKYLGRRFYIIFILTLLVAATEGFGITLLLPLLNQLKVGSSDVEPTVFEETLQQLLIFIGIQNSIIGILLFIGFVFLVKGMIKFTEGAYKSYLQAQLLRELQTRLLDNYSSMEYRYYIQHNTGHFINLIGSQPGRLIKSFDSYRNYLAILISLTAYFIYAFLISWIFASMALVAGAMILLLFRKLNNYVRNLSRKSVSEQTILNKFIVQTLQSFKYIVSTGEIEPLRRGLIKSIYRLTSYFRKQGIASAMTISIREPISVTVLIAIIVIQITVLEAPLAPIIVALVLIYRAMGQVINVQSSWQSLMSNIGSLEIIESEFEQVGQHQQTSGDHKLGPLSQGIELQEVYFAYNPEAKDVLKNITLTISANTTIALVGESGAGKSTLVDLITLMLRPTSGELLIDGVRHQEIDLNSWRQQIGYISQETVIFDDTIANNICMWRGDYNNDQLVKKHIEEVAEQAFARQFINELPEGFNTIVGDRGVRLSVGQKQRLFIARELYKNPHLLILDEATSALDSESELVIKKSIDNLKGSTTVVIIAHRLSTIKQVDYIYVLNNGIIIEQGHYEKLMDIHKGYFNRMVSLQNL